MIQSVSRFSFEYTRQASGRFTFALHYGPVHSALVSWSGDYEQGKQAVLERAASTGASAVSLVADITL